MKSFRVSVVILVLAVLAAPFPAWGVIDPDPDGIGIYFDLNADMNCMNTTPYVPFNTYVTITNPTADGIYGAAFGYAITVPPGYEGLIFRLRNQVPEGALDLGNSQNIFAGEYLFATFDPMPPCVAVQVVTWQFLLLGSFPVEFYLNPGTLEPSGPDYEAGGVIRTLHISSGDPSIPVAAVNDYCWGPIAKSSSCGFGSVLTTPALDQGPTDLLVAAPFDMATGCAAPTDVELRARYESGGNVLSYATFPMTSDGPDSTGAAMYTATIPADGDAEMVRYEISARVGGLNVALPGRACDGTRQYFEFRYRYHGWESAAGPELSAVARNTALACYDLDEDGYEDVLVVRDGQANTMLMNQGNGLFAEHPNPSFRESGEGTGAAWGDYDNDGDGDVFIANSGRNRLLENQAGLWRYVQEPAIEAVRQSTSADWVDLDRDGRLELYVANRDGADQLLWSQSGFTDLLPEGLGWTGPSQGSAWCDANMDMAPDLYLVGEGSAHRMFTGSHGAGFESTAIAVPISGQGCSWGDYDNDGDFDVFVTYWGQACTLLRNTGQGEFVAVENTGIYPYGWSQGSFWGDFDNDGHLDLFVAKYGEANELYHNVDGTGRFEVMPIAALAPQANSIGAVGADFDNDGDLDLLVANYESGCDLIRNDRLAGDHWLQVEVKGHPSGLQANRSGIGAVIEVQAGDLTMWRYVGGSTGYASQGPLRQHFGLGDATMADRITVYWPFDIGNGVHHVSALENVEGNRIVEVVEEELGISATPRRPQQSIALLGCAPNPFNPSTTIAIELGEPEVISLRVFDVSGRLVKSLLNSESREAGRNEVAWNGRDESGRQLASGTYFYRLDADGYSETKRMLLIK